MTNRKPTTDHTGTYFPTAKAMAEAWGVPYSRWRYRIAKGWSLKESLERPYIPQNADRHGPKKGRTPGKLPEKEVDVRELKWARMKW